LTAPRPADAGVQAFGASFANDVSSKARNISGIWSESSRNINGNLQGSVSDERAFYSTTMKKIFGGAIG
jgi:hypothetical protein